MLTNQRDFHGGGQSVNNERDMKDISDVERTCKSALLMGYGSVGKLHARLLNSRYPELVILDIVLESRKQASLDYPDAIVVSDLSELDEMNWQWETTMAVVATWGPSHYAIFNQLAIRGAKYILCEKPVADSVVAGYEMVRTAEELGISLSVHHHYRYSGFRVGLKKLSFEFGLGDPVAIFIHGGANGIITRGIHFVDVACELFGQNPQSVISTAKGDPINPRSPDLMFYGGTVAWDFGCGRELSFNFTNQSSLTRSFNIYYRDAVIVVFNSLEVEVRRRADFVPEGTAAVTRTREPTDIVYSGPIPGLAAIEDRTTRLLDDIESGNPSGFTASAAVVALGACIGALTSGHRGMAIKLPIDPSSDIAKTKWPIS